MSSDQKRPLAMASRIAHQLRDFFSQYCHQIYIAGSIRRKQPMIADIEIVAVPRIRQFDDLFGEPVCTMNMLLNELDLLEENNVIFQSRRGDVYRQVKFTSKANQSYSVDIFTATEANLGNMLALRTGSAAFLSHVMVHLKAQGMHHSGGYLYRGQNKIACPTEAAFFETIQFPYIAPEQRNDGLWQHAVRDDACNTGKL